MSAADRPGRFDPERDLVLDRLIAVRPDLVWRAWTRPDDLKSWFCPRPWRVVKCAIDLRPGGIFYTLMQGPNGEAFENTGCFLDIVENRRLVFTSALGPGFRPQAGGLLFTANVSLKAEGNGTRYRALALHGSPAEKQQHEAMGFEPGWSAALDQLVELAQAW